MVPWFLVLIGLESPRLVSAIESSRGASVIKNDFAVMSLGDLYWVYMFARAVFGT